MESKSRRQILKTINPVIGFHDVTISEKNNLTFSIFTTTSDIYVYSHQNQELVNQWSISQDVSQRFTVPAVLNRLTRFFYVVQSNRIVYIWSDKQDLVSSWKHILINDDVLALVTNDLFGDSVLIVTVHGHLSLLNYKDPERSLCELKNVEILHWNSISLDKKNVYLSLLYSSEYIILPILITRDSTNEFIYKQLPSHKIQCPEKSIPLSFGLHPKSNKISILFSNGSLGIYTFYADQDERNNMPIDQDHCQLTKYIDGIEVVKPKAKRTRKSSTLPLEHTIPMLCISDNFVLISTQSKDQYLQLWDIQYGILRSVVSTPLPVTSLCYSSFAHSMFISYEQEDSESKTRYYSIDLLSVSVEESTLAGAVKASSTNLISTDYPHILTLLKPMDSIQIGYNNSEVWKNEMKQEIDIEDTEYRDIYMEIMNDKPMTDEEFESKVLHYFKYQERIHENLSRVFFSQLFVIKCLNRCCLKDHCLYEPLFMLLNTYQVSINSLKDIIPYICTHCDLLMLEQAIRYIRDLSEKEILYITHHLIYSCSDKDFKEFLVRKTLYKDTYTALDCQKLTYYCLFPSVIAKRFSTKILSKSFAKYDIKIIIFLLQLTYQLLYDYDRYPYRIIKMDFVPLSQFYSWIVALLDSHLYDLIFIAQKDASLLKLLHNLEDYVHEYRSLSDTCYNVRSILTHIEEKVPLPVSAIPIYSIEEIPF